MPNSCAHPLASIVVLHLSLLMGCGGGEAITEEGGASDHSSSSGFEAPRETTGEREPLESYEPPRQEPSSPRADARYYVRVGQASTLSSSVGPELLAVAGARARTALWNLDGVEVAPHAQTAAAGQDVIRTRALHGLFVRCSVRRVEVGPQGTRAAIGVLVTTMDERDVLASLDGGALVPGASSAESRKAAIEAAIDSALRGLPTVLATLRRH